MTESGIRTISAADIRGAVGIAELLEPLRRAFATYSAGRTAITAAVLDLRDGDVHVKSAASLDEPWYVVKVASWVPGNAQRGLDASAGAQLVCSAVTGAPVALLQDGHHLTDLRTAAAGALAADLLAPDSIRAAGVLGTGVQARLQLVGLHAVRPFSLAHVWGRRTEAARALASRLERDLPGVTVGAKDDIEAVVRASDVLVTATASDAPLVRGEWLRAGQHVTAIGADDARKRELDAACLGRADRLIVDSRAQTCGLAEIGAALAAGTLREADVHGELGDVIAGTVPGRRGPEEITIAKLTGLGAQDLAAAGVVLARLAPELRA